MNKRIKPCPFCGGTAYVGYTTFSPDAYTVICEDCNMMIEKYGVNFDGLHMNFAFSTKEEAINAWNRRPNDVEA